MENRILSSKNIIVFILLALTIILLFYSTDIILMLFSAFVINCAISPFVARLEKYIPRVWASAILILALVVICFMLFSPIVAICIKELINLKDTFPNIDDLLSKIPALKHLGKIILQSVTFDSIREPLTQGAQIIVQRSITAGKSIAAFFTMLLGIIIVVFYISYDEKRLKEKFIEFFPKKQKEKASKILDDISQKVGNYVFAQVIAMVFVGILTTIGLIILGNKNAFILGFIAGVFDIIPVVGPLAAGTIGTISAYSFGIHYMVFTLILYLVVQWAENQFLRPIVFGKMLNMHPLMIIISLLLCARFFGLWGLILAPAIASVICVLVDELYLNRINEK